MQTEYKMATWNTYTNELHEWYTADSLMAHLQATAEEQRGSIWGLQDYVFVDADSMMGIDTDELTECGWELLR